MDLNTLINARLEMMGNDRPSSSCSTHGDTRKEAIAQAIEFLQRESSLMNLMNHPNMAIELM